MDRLEHLRETAMGVLEPYGVRMLAVFGSYARGEEGPESDVDLLVEFEEPHRQHLGLFQWVRLERRLGEQLGRPVDLVSAPYLQPHARPEIEREMKVLYEAE